MKNIRLTRISYFIMTLLFTIGILSPNMVYATDVQDTSIAITEELSLTELQAQTISPSEIPEVLDVNVLEKNNNVYRLYSQESDLYSAIFQNRDGSKTMYYFGYPIKYITESGDIQDKSTVLEPHRGDRYSYYTPYNDIQSFFPDKINSKTYITVATNDYEISFAPASEYISNAERTSNILIYKNAFGDGYSLTYQPQFWGLKEEIVISKNLGQYKFSFYLNTNGLIPFVQDNHVYLKTANDVVVGEISNVVLYDSAQVPNLSDNNTISLTPTNSRDIYRYTITIDESYMNDENTVYPVYVDPTITINSSGSGSSKTIMDTPVYSAVPTVCQGANLYNIIGNANGSSNGYGIGRTLMKFPGLVNNSVFQGVAQNQVSSLNLYVYFSSGSVNSSTAYVNLYTGSTWDESSTAYNDVTWSGYGTLLASSSIPAGNQWVSFDIKNAISTWQSNSETANKGVMIRNSNESSTSYAKTICSTESSYKPYISLTWSATAPSGITTGNIYQIKNSYSSRYISASTTTSITQTTSPSTTRGYALWRFEQVQTGVYRIESLGVRNDPNGLSGMMLTASATDQTSTDGTLSLTQYSASNTKQWWYVNKTTQGYSFISYYYPQLAISVSSSTGSPRLSANANYSKWTLTAKTYSNYWSGAYSGGTSPYTVNVIVEPSAVTGLLTNSVYSCATAWNGIDSNISVRYYASTYTGSYASADLTVLVRGVDSGGARLGRLVPTPSNLNGNWTSAVIEISTESSGTNSNNYTLYDRQMNFLHELGHALKLAHPHESDLSWHPVSIMNQGLPSVTSYLPSRPSGYDKYNLSRKW